MWVKSTKHKFDEYYVPTETKRKLVDDEHICHMEVLGNPEFVINTREDLAVKWFTEEEMTRISDETLTAEQIAQVEKSIETTRLENYRKNIY